MKSWRGACELTGILAIIALVPLSGLIADNNAIHAQVNGSNAFASCAGDTSGCPTGLASYGYNNASGTTFSTMSNVSIGYVSFDSLQANNSDVPRGWALNDPSLSNASTLQLNNMLVVRNGNGVYYDYWAQNVLAFGNSSSSSAPTIIPEVNVFNMSSGGGGLSSAASVTSQNGTVAGPPGGYYYGNYVEAPYFAIETPFAAEQISEAYTLPSSGVVIYNYLYIMQNGSSWPNRLLQFDAARIVDPHAQDAYFYVNDSASPAGLAYDSEYVFGGPGSGASTSFSKMNGTVIGLYHSNSTANAKTPFESYYSFGWDTAETAENLLVNYIGGGLATVSIGTPYYGPLSAESSSTTTTSSSTTSSSTSSSSTSNSSEVTTSTSTNDAQDSTTLLENLAQSSSSSTLSSIATTVPSSISGSPSSYSISSTSSNPIPSPNSSLSNLNFVEAVAIGSTLMMVAAGVIGLSRRRA